MRIKRTWLAVPAALALALTACGGGSGDQSGNGGESGAAASGGIVEVNGSEPQNPLIPANTNETGGGRLLDVLFAGLTYYDETGASHMEMAESIETDDHQTYTVKLKEGLKFSDGSDLKAKNFVEAWKLGAKEAMLSAYFFAPIEGADEEGNGDLTGLEVVDDTTFTIKLKQPEADFEQRLGYSAFYPLPDSTLADPKAGGENPVGNGPYMADGEGAWVHNEGFSLVPNPEYKGERVPQNGGLHFTFYAKQDAAYQDLVGNNLDVLDAIPENAFQTYESELNGRSVNQPAAIFQAFTIPNDLEHFTGEEGKLRRQAISYAINREEVTEKIFSGTRTPAKDFTSPVVDGFNDSIPGSEVLTYDADKAKELWAQAEAIAPFEGKFTIAYNSDGGHQGWVDATVNSIKNTLGIEAEGNPYPDFKSLRDDVTNGAIKGAMRAGWQADYPGKYNFLAPIYATGASANDGNYSNPAFDELLTKSSGASSLEESNKLLDQAQEILFQDLPAIPLWYSNVVAGWSENVDNVKFDWHSVPMYYLITKQ